MKFGQLFLMKITLIVATRCYIFRLKCTKFDSAGASTQTPRGELTALPRPLAGFKGPTSNGREGKEGEERKGGEAKGKRKEGDGYREGCPFKFLNTPLGAITCSRIHVVAKPYMYL